MTHLNTRRWFVDRRRFLRGAGAALALPWLDCMQPARAQPNDDAGGPRRCVFVYVPNGVNTLTWQIERAGTDYELTAPLRALERHRADITPLSGLYHPAGLGRAHRCEKVWLTGAEIGDEGAEERNSVSADQLMAEVAGLHTRFPSLELTLTDGTLAWSRDGIALPAERKPGAVFRRLFGTDPGGVESTRERLRSRASVLDLVLEDARSLRRAIGSDDRSKLDEYLAAVRDVELRTARADSWLDTPKPAVDAATKNHLTRNIPDSAVADYLETVYDLMVLALATDMTRVITFMCGSESRSLPLRELGIAQARHELSHHNGIPEKMARLSQLDAFLTQHFAAFLDRLLAADEGGVPLLDRTMVLYGSGMSYGHSHGNANLPLILAGGKSLGLRHGRHVDFNLPQIGAYHLDDAQAHYALCLRPVDERARLSNLLLTLLQRMDVETEAFSDSEGTLSEIVS